jgi:outer membrane protein OmpA-like peptidoglycan-associated protein
MTNDRCGAAGGGYFPIYSTAMPATTIIASRHIARYFRSILPAVALFFFALPHGLQAQGNLGMASGNYAGISGAWLNPASIVDSRYKFDMAIAGYDNFFTNNFLLMSNRTLARSLFRKEPYNGSYDAVRQDLLTPLNEVEGKVHADTYSEWQFPFSFMATTGPRSAIALNIRNRTGQGTSGMDPSTARMLFDNLGNESLMGTAQDNSGLRYTYINWMEVGFTYGRVLIKGRRHFLKGAGSIKLLAGGAAGFWASDDLRITFEDPAHVSIESPLIRYGRTERADIDTYQRRNLLNGVEDFAIGWDVGLVYELRGNVSKSHFTDLDLVEKERQDLNKYFLRVGVSLLDVGKFKFERRELTGDHSANITGWDIAQANASDFDQFDTAYAPLVNYVPDASSPFTYRLPAAIAANLDVHVFGGFYLNVGGYTDATSYFQETSTTLHAVEWVAFTPRFESRGFGLYVPVSQCDEKTRIGATVRIGPIYFGSNNLADQLANDQNTQADYHFGVRFSIGHGKPTALRRKYEAMRMQQAGISKNSTRIDSLEREVYALRMVLLADTSNGGRGATIVNNYYGSLPADTAVQRLEAANDDLAMELAKAQLRAEQDSIMLERVADGSVPPKEAAKEARKSREAAEGNSDAANKMAKEMKRQRKAMERQNLILAAGVTTGIVAAASDGNEKPKPTDSTAVAMLLNDSTIVLGTDTLPLRRTDAVVVAAPIVIHDTVYVQRTDTVRTHTTDTLRTERVAVDMDALTAPIYFANGSTKLGPNANKGLDRMAAWLKANPTKRLLVTGHADATGSLAANQTVSKRRAESVKAALVARGIDGARITTEGRVAEQGSKPSAEDRRAELKVGE